MPLSTLTVTGGTGGWVTPTGAVAGGQVTITPVADAPGGGYIVVAAGVTVPVVNGNIAATLVNNDQATTLQYLVTERITGSRPVAYVVTPTGSTLDLSTAPRGQVGQTTPLYVLASAVGQIGGPAGPLDSSGHLPAGQIGTIAESPVSSVFGRTGAVTGSKVDVGLDNVDNTADATKPVSTAIQAALDTKLDTTDPRLTDSRAPTGPAGGSLSGTFPNPSIAGDAVGGSEIAAAIKDPVAGMAGLRTLGTGAQQAVAGNDTRLSDTRTPGGVAGGDLAGSYPNPTIKTALNDPGAVTPGLRTLGSSGQQACAGNDARLSDARTPTAHTHPATDVTGLAVVATSGGYTDLTGKPAIPTLYTDLAGTVPAAALPALAVVDFLGAVATQSAMLALVGQKGDWCTRTDVGSTWVIKGDDPTQLTSWQELLYPTSPVSSVFGRTGAVTGSKADVGLSNVDDTADAAKPVSTATQAALNAKLDVTDPSVTNARTPTAHKATHATGGGDALTPADIGAATTTALTAETTRATTAEALKLDASQKAAASGVASLDVDTKVPIAQIPTGTSSSTVALGNDSRLADARTPTAHKTSHATGGSDALAPADIGAATASALTAETTRATTAETAKLSTSGGTVSGDVIFNGLVGLGTATPQEALDVNSDTATQRRIRTVSYLETDSVGSAETIRLHAANPAGKTGNSAKNAIAWYLDDASTTQAQVWAQAHDYLHWYNAITIASVDTAANRVTLSVASDLPSTPGWRVQFSTTGTLPAPLTPATNYYAKRITGTVFEIYSDAALTSIVDLTTAGTGVHTMTPDNTFGNNRHRHFSIEVSNADLANKNTRFSIPWGFDWTQIGVFQSDFNVNDGKLRVLGAAGGFRQIVLGNTLSDNLTPDGTEGRWSIQANNTAETAGNVGSDFRLVRYSNTGVALDAPVFVKRSNGRIAIGTTGNTSPQAALDLVADGTVSSIYVAATALGTASIAVVRLETTDVTKRVLDYRLTGDGASRLRVDATASGSGTLTFGDGTSVDTNLYRSAADTLKTDDSLVVTGSLTVGGVAVGGDRSVALPADHGMKAWSFDPATASSVFAAISGTLYLTALYIRSSITVTKIWYGMGTAAGTPTAGQNFAGIFSSAGAVLVSAGIDTQVTGSNGPQNVTISSTTLPAGTYWVGVLQNATTPQQLVRSAPAFVSIANAGIGTSLFRACVNGTGLTAMPSSITPASNSSSGAVHLWTAVS